MIPKKIHYVWLGHGEKSEKIKYCMETWKKYLSDYEIKEWNEENFDLNFCDFTRRSYDLKQYAFTSDVIRLYALLHEGGIYMDTDVEVYQSLDEFLTQEAFTGYEDKHYPVTATMGAEPGNPVIQFMLDFYKCVDFKTYPKWQDYITNQETNTCILSNILRNAWSRQRSQKHHTENKTFHNLSTKLLLYSKRGLHVSFIHRELGTMKIALESIVPARCMKRICKVCEKRTTCDLKEKLDDTYEPLTYKPFENLKEIMDERNKMH